MPRLIVPVVSVSTVAQGLRPFDPHGGISEVGAAVGEVSDVGPVPEDDAHRLMGEDNDACYSVARYFRQHVPRLDRVGGFVEVGGHGAYPF